MTEKLFSIGCETCGCRLAVRDLAIIGQILSCPKCSSMVQVQPPPGWTAPAGVALATATVVASAQSAQTPAKAASSAKPVAATPAPAATPASAATPAHLSSSGSAVAGASSAAAKDRWKHRGEPAEPTHSPAHAAPSSTTTSAASAPPASPVAASVAGAPPVGAAAVAAEQVPLIADPWMSPARRWLRRYGPTTAAATIGVAGTLLVWNYFTRDDNADATPPNDAIAVVEPAEEVSPSPTDAKSAPTPKSPIDSPAAIEQPAKNNGEKSKTLPAAEKQPVDKPAIDNPTDATPDTKATEPAAVPPVDKPPVAPPSVPPSVRPPEGENPPPHDDATKAPANVPAPNAAPERPSREPLRTVDVPARLKDKIAKLDYTKAPLTDVLGVLSRFSTIPITVDVDAITAAGIRSDVPVTIKQPNKSVEEALGEAVSSVGLRYLVVDQHILVTAKAPSEAAPTAIRRDVTDLAGGDALAAEALAATIRKLVAPASWQSQRTTSLRADGAALVITQSPAVVREIDRFLAQLRAVRRDPIGAAKHPPVTLQTHYGAARATLDHKLTLNYAVPTPLGKILARLQKDAGLLVLVDWQALAAEDIGPATETRLAATARPVEEVLAALAEPLDLAFRVIDDHTVQLTTRGELSARAQLEAYALGDLADSDTSAAALAKALVTQFNMGAVSIVAHVDAKSETLFLLAPQDVQIHAEKLIAAARAKVKAK